MLLWKKTCKFFSLLKGTRCTENWKVPSNKVPLYHIRSHTYSQRCLSNLLRISLSRNASQHCAAVSNILSLQLRVFNIKELISRSSAVKKPQWYSNDCTSRRTSSLKRESDVPVRQVSIVDDRQNSSLAYPCLNIKEYRHHYNWNSLLASNKWSQLFYHKRARTK